MEDKNKLRKPISLFLLRSLLLFILYLMLVPFSSFAADDSVCARVKIEIQQELTLERQAFDAHMRINNGLSNITLENVDIDVSFSDENGNIVRASFDPNDTSALFFIRLDSMEGISNVDGNGTVQPSSSADIHWLIIPAPGASNGLSQGKLYYVGATLRYTIGGEEHVTNVSPDYIFVKPMPEMTLDYFLPTDVYGDDAFTPEIEPPVPFSLGVRVKNNGSGVARNLKIDSAQPKIVENEQGLLIGFNIEGTEVNGKIITNSLLADFGDIQPNTSGVARWIMTCTLSGEFVEFKAEYSHSDELGGELTSLIDAVNTHFLVHDVLVDLPGRDGIRDFLAKDSGVFRVYESDTLDTDVLDQSAYSGLQFKSQAGSEIFYTLSTPVTAGFMYVQLSDPHGGTKVLKEVIRSDGKIIKIDNAWLSKTRNEDHSWRHFFNLFDVNTTNSYTVVFVDIAAGNRPPVLQFVPDRTGYIGKQLSFIVEASDPDGTVPSLTTFPLPAHATFTDQGNGVGIFDWTPAEGQAGQYDITFTASDGLLTDSEYAVLTIKVAPDPPVADAGRDQNVVTNKIVTLNGSESYDPGRFMITFLWSFEEVPPGSAITNLSDITSAKPTFTPDVDGTYRLKLIVNNGSADSAPDEVEIIAATLSVAPNAFAGPDKNVLIGETVALDGSESNDPDNLPGPLSYIWSFDFVPDASSLTNNDITDKDKANATFIPDVEGTYMLRLAVNDGEHTSEDTVQIKASAVSIPPNADAGADITIYQDETAILDGSASNDPDNGPEPLVYNWSFVAVPTGSQLNNDSISDANTATPSFIPDIGGTYVLELTVSDGFALDYDNVAATYIPNRPPEVEDLSVTTDEDTPLGITLTGSDQDGDTLTFSVIDGPANGTLSGDAPNLTYTPNSNFHGSDSFTYMANDSIEDSAIATVAITINEVNDPPVCTDDDATTDEDTSVTIAVITNDNGGPLDEDQLLTVASVTQGVNGTVINNGDGTLTYTPNSNYNGPDSFTYTVSDSGGQTNTGTVMVTVNPVNDAPTASVDLSSQTVQYSDTVTPVKITVRDVDSSGLTASTNLPSGLSLSSQGCFTDNGLTTCFWEIEGQAMVGTGTYDVTTTVSDGELDSTATTSFSVVTEDADVAFDGENPIAVQVAAPGGNTGMFSLKTYIWEIDTPEDSPGDINLAGVEMSLVPVGPGPTVVPMDACTRTVEGAGYDAVLQVMCNFNDVAVNTYTIQVVVIGSNYVGYNEDVLVVYDPSLGFATGGGWFYWPDTDNPEINYLGDRTNFGFTMKYTKKGTNLQGNLLLIRHLIDGAIYRIKSNALYGLALGESSADNEEFFGWASFSGKSTYFEPGWLVPVGNYEFIVYVEDRNEPGSGVDGFWIQVKDKDGNLVVGMSLASPATSNAKQLKGGNIVVPHR